MVFIVKNNDKNKQTSKQKTTTNNWTYLHSYNIPDFQLLAHQQCILNTIIYINTHII